MGDSQECCECCEMWSRKYLEFKAKLFEGSRQIVRALQIEEENKQLIKKLKDKQEITQSLRDDCSRYQKELLAKMEELESVKQLYSSTSAVQQQERDEARKAHQEAQTALESLQASMKQYQALFKEHQEEASQAQSRTKSLENRVSYLEKKLNSYKEQAKEARSENKKAMGWLRSFDELLKHPESWSSVKLQEQKESLSALLQPEEDEELQLGSSQLEAFLQTCTSSTEEVTRDELMAVLTEMRAPCPMSPLPPRPEPSEKMQSECPPQLVPATPPCPMSPLPPRPEPPEKMQSECPPQLVPATPVSDAGPGLQPPALLSEPVSLPHNSEAFKEATSSKTLSDVISPTLMPLEPMSDLVRLAPAASSSELPVSSMQLALFSSKPASPPASLGEPESVVALLEPAPRVSPSKPQLSSAIVLPEPGPPVSLLEPVPTIALLKPTQPASMKAMTTLVPASPSSSSDEEEPLIIALSEEPLPSPSEEPTSVISLSEITSFPSPEPEPTSAVISSERVQPGSMEQELASVIALSEPAPPPPSLEEPASVTALPVPPLKPQFPQEPAPHTFSLQYEAESVMPQPGQPASLKPKPTLAIAVPEPAPLVASSKQEQSTITLSEPAPAVFAQKPVRASVIVLSEQVLPVSLKAKPTSVIALSEPAPSSSLEEPPSVIALSESVAPVSLQQEPASVSARSEPLVEAALKPLPRSVPTVSESLPPASSLEPQVSVIDLSKLAPQKSPDRPMMSETSLLLSQASSSLDTKPPVLISKKLEMTSSLELMTPLSPELVLPPTLSEPVSLIPLEPMLPTPEPEPACKALSQLIGMTEKKRFPEPVTSPRPGPSSLAGASKSWCAASTTRNTPGGPKQQLHGPSMEQRPTGKELSAECKPLSGGTVQEQLASPEVPSQVVELPPRKQWMARKKRVVNQQVMKSEPKHERQKQAKDGKKLHSASSKKPRLTKQLMRELFSSSSEDEEASEENTYASFCSSAEHAALRRVVTGRMPACKEAQEAVQKLAWLAKQPEVRPGVVASFVRDVERDPLIYAILLYVARTKANPVSAYCRGVQSPPLTTKVETLLLEAMAEKTDGWPALLSSLLARFCSPHQSLKMLGKGAYVRLVFALCRELEEPKLALDTVWDLLLSAHAPFLVASAVGAWPGLLSALPLGPVQKAVGYLLLRCTEYTLNPTLKAQARKTLRELGPLQEFEGDERALFDELLSPLLSPHQQCTANCATHRLALEQLSRRSPDALQTWLLKERLGPHVQSLLCQPNAVCFLRLLGSLWKSYSGAADKLQSMLSEIVSSPTLQEATVRDAAVQAFLLLPDLYESPWSQFFEEWQQSS